MPLLSSNHSARPAAKALVTAALLSTALLAAVPAAAQTAPSDSAMVNLVRALVAQGVISKAKGDELMAQAEAEAAKARAGAAAGAGTGAVAGAAAGTIRVPYVPETVREQIKTELKNEVLAQAKAEGWASPEAAAPDWTKRITIGGDLRVRSFSEFYSRSNSDQIVDFAAINDQAPFDIFGPVIPTLNSRKDRSTADFRLRLNIKAQVSDELAVDLQLATGDDRSPISVSETLGGGLRPRNFWVQKAAIVATPNDWSKIWLGRFSNPFTSHSLVTERVALMFDNDLAFDGGAAEANVGKALDIGFDATVRGGAFPIDFGNRNYVSTQFDKTNYPVKWFYSGQLELGKKFENDLEIQGSVAYHNFQNVQGQLSLPCLTYQGQTECSTDGYRPNFIRKGNTLSPLRSIVVDPSQPPGIPQPQPQVFAPTFDYDVLHLSGEVSFPLAEKLVTRVTGQYLNNLAFKKSDLCRNGDAGAPFNNAVSTVDSPPPGTTVCSSVTPDRFIGGNEGYQVGVQIGTPKLKTWGDWSATLAYRYLESDATLDAFTDSDFHLGGTNTKGFIIGAEAGLAKNMVLGARWLSGNEVDGEPFAIDVLQVELVVSF